MLAHTSAAHLHQAMAADGGFVSRNAQLLKPNQPNLWLPTEECMCTTAVARCMRCVCGMIQCQITHSSSVHMQRHQQTHPILDIFQPKLKERRPFQISNVGGLQVIHQPSKPSQHEQRHSTEAAHYSTTATLPGLAVLCISWSENALQRVRASQRLRLLTTCCSHEQLTGDNAAVRRLLPMLLWQSWQQLPVLVSIITASRGGLRVPAVRHADGCCC